MDCLRCGGPRAQTSAEHSKAKEPKISLALSSRTGLLNLNRLEDGIIITRCAKADYDMPVLVGRNVINAEIGGHSYLIRGGSGIPRLSH